jgi:exopolysaccharide biosynthesis polyprenyl glycosylphosphotransferase
MGFGFLYRGFSFSRLVFFLIFIDSIILLLITRFIFHKIKFYFLKKGYNVLKVILAGSPSLLKNIYNNLKENKIYQFAFTGYIASQNCNLPIDYLGNSENIADIEKIKKSDGFILAYDSQEHANILKILKFTEGKNLELFYVPDILDLLTSHINVLEINGTPLFQFKTFTLSGWQGLIKRSFDILVSLISIVLLSPLFLLLAILIKIDSKGPVFYKQKRVSLDGNEFKMIKFRSMRTDAESESGPVWAKQNDPRTTKTGKFLRRSSLDELPQLLNILVGDMSLVGPRPERLHFINQFKDDIPKYLERHRLRSGMTGWAQVNGLRGQSPIEERTKYDLFYIENWSLWFDIKIIIKTFIAIFRGENAY